MDWDPRKLYEQALAALDAGESPRRVDAQIEKVTGGQFKAFRDLSASVGGAEASVTPAAAQQRLSAGGGNAVTDFIRMMGQGLSMNFADEVLGDRQRVEDLRTLAPRASLASEIAGAAALPAAGATGLTKLATPVMGATAAGITSGGLMGGAGAGVYGMGDAEGGVMDRSMAAKKDALLGLALGGTVSGAVRGGGAAVRAIRRGASGVPTEGVVGRALREAGILTEDVPGQVAAVGEGAVVSDLAPASLGREAKAARNFAPALDAPGGPVEALARRAQDRGERIAGDLRKASQIPLTYSRSLEAAEEARKAVSKGMYRPLEDAFPEVRSQVVADALKDPRIQSIVRRRAPEAAIRRGTGPARGMEFPPERGPSFQELQDVLVDLRDDATSARASGRPGASQRATEALELLQEAMKDIPGFPEAQAAYSVALRRIDAHELGKKMVNKDPDEIVKALQKLPEEAREGFRLGMLDEIELALRERVGGGAEANALVNAGKTMIDRLRVVAKNDPAMSQLLSDLSRERTYQMTWNAISGNSTTAGQLSDILGQQAAIPSSKQQLLRSILVRLVGLTPEERRAASEQIGRALLGDGKEAAEMLANEIVFLKAVSTRAARAGAAAGTTAGVVGGR